MGGANIKSGVSCRLRVISFYQLTFITWLFAKIDARKLSSSKINDPMTLSNGVRKITAALKNAHSQATDDDVREREWLCLGKLKMSHQTLNSTLFIS
jgi:hypothetical protein